LIIGGDQGYGGAVMMAAEAAMTTGVGLVTVATQPCHITPLLCRRPEVMAWGITQSEQLIPLLAKASALVVGPGLGQTHWSRQLLETALASELPVVLDADGLNLLAQSPLLHKRANWLLTPHPGEAARLLAAANNPLATSQQVQADRPSAVAGLQHHYGGVAVLKGAGTLICGEQQPLLLCPLGNPGMASGGMGDVLSGVLGGLLAQGLSLLDSAQLGVWLHSRSGDLAAEKAGKRGLLATDLLSWLRTIETGSNLQD
jgi:NAD(P)H-hydrate epimerase